METKLVEKNAGMLQLEARRQGYDAVQRHVCDTELMPKVKEAMTAKGDYISETLTFMHGAISIHDKLSCATSSRVNSEYCVNIFETASKDSSLSEKQRDTAKFLAEEFGRRAKEDIVFEKMYMIDELLGSRNFKEAAEFFKEVKPKMADMANFYLEDMEKKLKSEIILYIDREIPQELLGWKTLKEGIGQMGSSLDMVEKNFESEEGKKKFRELTQSLAIVRDYEDELSLAYARKMGVFKNAS